MKTNYGLLLFNFVISVFMLFSLNSFSTSEMYLPALFLYFLSNVAAFIDKYIYYKELNYSLEKLASAICFLSSVAMVCLYIFNSLDFIEITFQNSCGTYHMLVQGVPNSFVTFNSINITCLTLIFAVLAPVTYLFFCTTAYLRERGYTLQKIIKIISNHKIKTTLVFVGFIVSGLIGVLICHRKSINVCNGLGEPQYLKYFISFFFLTVFIFSLFFFTLYKDNEDNV